MQCGRSVFSFGLNRFKRLYQSFRGVFGVNWGFSLHLLILRYIGRKTRLPPDTALKADVHLDIVFFNKNFFLYQNFLN